MPDLEITLPAPITVKEQQVVETELSTVEVEAILFDLKNKEIGIKFKGVEARTVIRDAAYTAIQSQLSTPFRTIIESALTPEE